MRYYILIPTLLQLLRLQFTPDIYNVLVLFGMIVLSMFVIWFEDRKQIKDFSDKIDKMSKDNEVFQTDVRHLKNVFQAKQAFGGK